MLKYRSTSPSPRTTIDRCSPPRRRARSSDIYVSRLREAVAIRSVSAWPDHRPEVSGGPYSPARVGGHLSEPTVWPKFGVVVAQVVRMINWTKDWIDRLGGVSEMVPNPAEPATPPEEGEHGSAASEQHVPLPPILLGTFGSDPKKRTVCVYGHLDVQPALLSDGASLLSFFAGEEVRTAPATVTRRGGATGRP